MTSKMAQNILTRELKDLCGEYGIKPTPKLIFSRRLKTTAGCLRIQHAKGLTTALTIELNPAYLDEFGYGRIHRTFLHEVAHAICWVHYEDHGHSKLFRKTCLALGGSLPLSQGGQEKAWLKEPWRWQYDCPNCNAGFRRKRRFSLSQRRRYKCRNCGAKLEKWQETRLEGGFLGRFSDDPEAQG